MSNSLLSSFRKSLVGRSYDCSKSAAKKFRVHSAPTSPKGYAKPYKNEVLDALITRSVDSELISVLASERLYGWDPLVWLWRRRARSLAHAAYSHYRRILVDEQPELVVVANGRHPDQAVLEYAARELNLEVVFYERGFADDGYFLQEFPTQDRLSVQAAAKIKSASIGEEQSLRLSNKWISERKTAANPYFRGKNPAMEEVLGRRDLVIFPSSPDEFVLLEKWSRGSFPNQFDGFINWMEANREGFDHLVVRVHPNSINKPTGFVIREIFECRRLRRWARANRKTSAIYASTSKVNSYRLIEKAEIVLVSSSTAGLEAALMGKKVWVIWDTAYDQVVQLAKWPEDHRFNEEFSSRSISTSAARFLAGLKEMDHGFEPHVCSSEVGRQSSELPQNPQAAWWYPARFALWILARTARGLLFGNLWAHVVLRIGLRRELNRAIMLFANYR